MFFKAEMLFLEKDTGWDSKKETHILHAIFKKFRISINSFPKPNNFSEHAFYICTRS